MITTHEPTTAPSAASLLIDVLQPKHRALLFSAIQMVKTEIESEHAAHVAHNEMRPQLAQRMSDYMRWNIREFKEISNILFGECFHDDLDPLNFFQRDLPNKPHSTIEKPAAKFF